MRARRPERFSDSVASDEPILDRSILEHHLSTLTNRSQETAFATFARHLAEREVCPNLLPQTGPTGGGDSKVDSETYPVGDEIALGWYEGWGKEAASERWGFAFSAKKEWKGKAIADVDKAVATGRGYTKIFFISNQYIRDKARAEVEDELSKKHGVDVRIFDKTWILEKVFENRREELAIADLQLQTSTRKQIRTGPLDIQREAQLKAIEGRIQNAITEGRQGIQFVEDCGEAAGLARGLERARTEVEGLYERAERMASKHGTSHQRLMSAYDHAWTTYWWYEDYERFVELYDTVEQRAKEAPSGYDLELLTNLWTILHSAAFRGKLERGRAKVAKRTATLLKELDRLRRQEDQPSAALQARALQLMVKLSLALAANGPIEPILPEFQEVVRSCEGLIGFPLEPLIKILTELGKHFGELPAYDELFQTVLKVQERRKGDVAAARMLVTRGSQQFKADRPYDAIRTLGLSLRRLYKHETRGEAVRALYMLGCAYERVGLLWAARGTLLSAASLATSELATYGDVTSPQAACYRRLKWLELQLGRVPQTLSWHEVDIAVRHVLNEKSSAKANHPDEEFDFDAILGILLLRTDPWELKRVSALPVVLDRLGLFSASAALLYALGYENDLPEGLLAKCGSPSDRLAFFLQWRDQPAAKDMPEAPAFYEEQNVELKSHLLGCDITIKSQNVSPCVELAESVLAALESLLSTGTVQVMASAEPALTIDVRRSDFAKEPFEFELQDNTGRPHINITCNAFTPHSISTGAQAKLKDKLFELLGAIFARIVITHDVPKVFESLLRDELALDRSLGFTGSFITVANVLGRNPKSQISSWSDSEAKEYPPVRPGVWDADSPRAKAPADSTIKPLTPGKGEPPDNLRNYNRVKQSEILTVSLIRFALWDKARWSGTVYATGVENSNLPPELCLGFENAEAAKDIFHFWKAELGDRDTDERLRVVIVRGISVQHPHRYRVLIGSNLDRELRARGVRHVVAVTRINTMLADSDANLERFLRSYQRAKSYILTAAAVTPQRSFAFIAGCPKLIKRELHIRQAWEIGKNDPDSVGILADDEPIVPGDQKSPPVKELLTWKRARGRTRE